MDYKEIIDIRRTLHRYPELAYRENKTQKIILSFLANLPKEKIKITKYKTGIIVFIKGLVGEKTIAYRAEMDALPIEEKNDVTYRSMHTGIMHACGHDIHMAVSLGLINEIVTDDFNDNFLFIFQPAEEGMGGALDIINNSILSTFKIDEIYAIHIDPALKTNEIVVKEGLLFAIAQEITVDIIGKSAHAAYPDEGIDSIAIATHFLNSINMMTSRLINPSEHLVISFGKINGGTARNIVAERTTIKGTIRVLSNPSLLNIKEKIASICTGIETMFKCKVNINYGVHYSAVVNNSELALKFSNHLKEVNNYINIKRPPYMYGEDFGEFTKIYNGLLIMIGAESPYPLHHEMMLPNEIIIKKTIDLFTSYFINKEKR